MKELDGKYIVNREAQQEVFSNMLKFGDDARLLVIHDKEGTGKSTLLRRLKYKCEWGSEPVPVSLVDLQDKVMDSTIALLSRIRDDLDRFQIAFPSFDKLNMARLTYDPTQFASGLGSIVGTVNASGAYITGGKQAGTLVEKVESGATMVMGSRPTSWSSPDLERIARSECAKAFFDDLKAACQNSSIVLLFDSWDVERDQSLKDWVRRDLLRPHCFDLAKRPARLLVVIAGREDLDLAENLGARYEKLVRANPFTAWNEEHIKAFVKLHEYDAILDKADWEWLIVKIKSGKMTPGKALEYFKLLDAR